MVSFSCDQCADVVKKPQLDQHRERCGNITFTCLDCSETFGRNEYKSHTSCISEVEKYQKGTLKKNKKQEKSLDKSKQMPAKQEGNNGNETGQVPTLKNEDKKNKKELKKRQDQIPLSLVSTGSKKNKSKKKKTNNIDSSNESREETVENKNGSEAGSDAIKELDGIEKILRKRKAQAQPPVKSISEKDEQPIIQVKGLDAPKIENIVQKSKKKKSEPQLLNKHSVKTQNLDQLDSKDNNNERYPMDFLADTSEIYDKSLKRKNEQQAIESKVNKKQKNAVETSEKQKQNTLAVEISFKQQTQVVENPSSEKVNGKKKKKKSGASKGEMGDDGLDFKLSATEVVKKIFKEGGEHQVITLLQLEKMVIDQFTADPKNTLNSREMRQKFKENIAFVFKNGKVLMN